MEAVMSSALAKLVIVCGIKHSGTTVLLDMLRAHPQVFAPFELGLMLADGTDRDSLDKWAKQHPLPWSILRRRYGLDVAALQAMGADGSWLALYEHIFAHMLKVDKVVGRDILVDKKPEYTRVLLSHVYPRLPDTAAIIIYRDPRAVYCSWVKRAPRRSQIKTFVFYYTKFLRNAVAVMAAAKPAMLMKFESLVLFPERQMQQVAQFLGLHYDPAMVDPANSYAQDKRTKFTHPHFVAGRQLRSSGMDRATLTEWSEQLKPGEADEIVTAIPDDLTWAFYDHREAV
jgi:Sulfotransferase family